MSRSNICLSVHLPEFEMNAQTLSASDTFSTPALFGLRIREFLLKENIWMPFASVVDKSEG